MEQGMARRATDSIRRYFRGRAAFAALLLILVSAVSFVFVRTAYAAGERDRMLEESGIRYPDGFDAQTVGEAQGKAYGFYRPSKGPVSFDLRTKWEVYRVIASPPWYWDDLNVQLPDGEDVQVIGSKSLGNDGRLYIIAQEIHLSQGQSLLLRDRDGTALWKGGRQGASDGGAGWGASSRGRGGIGGGYSGGAGRGRR
jgi:hypothetical protein